MSRDPLFRNSSIAFDEYDLAKYANEKGIKMPEDETQWEQAISDHIASYMPYITQYPVSIDFEEKDAKRGYAKGRLDISNQVSVPLIMQNFRLMPLDVMAVGDHFEPLSERGLNQILLPRNLAAKPVSKEDSQTVPVDIDQSHRPPYSAYANRNAGYKTAGHVASGYRSYGHGTPYSSILDKVEIDSRDVESFREKLASDHAIAFEAMNRAPELLKKLASRSVDYSSLEGETVVDRIKKIARAEGWPVNVMQLHKVASGQLEVMVSSDYYPLASESKSVGVKNAVNMFGVDSVKKAMAGEPVTLVMGRQSQDAIISDGMQFPMNEMHKFGQYDAISADNRIVRGYFIPDVYNFGMQKIADRTLFTSRNEYFLQEKVAGRTVTNTDPIHGNEVGFGDTGSFLFLAGEKVAATIPLTITSFPLVSRHKLAFEGFTADGEHVSLDMIDGITCIVPGEKLGHYYVPRDWQWTHVGTAGNKLLSNSDDITTKVAACLCDHQIDIIWDGVNYMLKGSQVNGLSKPMDQLDPDDALFTLTSFGLSAEHSAKALCEARAKGKSTVFAELFPKGRYEVVSNAIEHQSGSKDTKLASAVSSIRKLAMVKEALVAEDEDTVDNVLALNFVTPQNIQQYVENIDDFKGATAKLAHLLIATRLGMRPIDPVAVKTAMENMSQVVEELEVLRSSLAEMSKQQKK
jgi:hypothetical protein